MSHARRRLVVLASGNGSNFQAIIDAVADGTLAAEVAALVSDRPAAHALARAAAAGIPAEVIERRPGEPRRDFDVRLAKSVAGRRPDLIVLAGWMRLLSTAFLGRVPARVVNLHPALPGEFPGLDAIERAYQAARTEGLRRTGVMVHFVPDEGVDDGPVIATAEVPILPDDSLAALTDRVHACEHRLLVDALRQVVGASSSTTA